MRNLGQLFLGIIGILFWTPFVLKAQVITPLEVEISDINNQLIHNPYLGTLTSPQFSEEDLNLDGIKDLFIFDRRGNTPIVFIGDENGNYVHHPEMAEPFPKTMHSWAMIRDFNGDGIGDVFSAPQIAGIPGIEIYTGKIENGKITYENFDLENEYNALEYNNSGSGVIIYVAFSDFPGIIDIDNDGDIDVISFDPGGAIARLYRNYAIERNGSPNKFEMELEDFCWGKFRENDFSSELTLSTNPNLCASALREDVTLRHSGSTMAFFDKNRDGVLDLLLGDLSTTDVAFLENAGNNVEAWMNKLDKSFPTYNVPIAVDFFTGVFAIDVDKDGKKDILAAPNSRLANSSLENVWHYRDVGSDTSRFELQKKNIFLEGSLSMGGFTHPCLIDLDDDGDQDLLVGVRGLADEKNEVIGAIHYFENESTDGKISFVLRDNDFLQLKSISNQSGTYAPAAGDLDADGDVDLIIGDREGKLIFFLNSAGPNNAPKFEDFIYEYQDIDVGQNAKPQMIDINLDGQMDLVVGERNDNKEGEILGGLNLFINTGSKDDPIFNPTTGVDGNTSVMAGIFTRDDGVSVGASSPLIHFNGENHIAIVGSESGQLKLYNNISDHIYDTAPITETNILPYNIGGNTTVTGGDLNGNNKLDIIVGSNLGALYFFETNIKLNNSVSIKENENWDISIYPNPSNGVINVKSKKPIDKLELLDLSGSVITVSEVNKMFTQVPDGLYLLRIVSGEVSETKKLIIIND